MRISVVASTLRNFERPNLNQMIQHFRFCVPIVERNVNARIQNVCGAGECLCYVCIWLIMLLFGYFMGVDTSNTSHEVCNYIGKPNKSICFGLPFVAHCIHTHREIHTKTYTLHIHTHSHSFELCKTVSIASNSHRYFSQRFKSIFEKYSI